MGGLVDIGSLVHLIGRSGIHSFAHSFVYLLVNEKNKPSGL